VVPHVTIQALNRASPSDLAALDELFAEQLRALDERRPLDAVAELELRIRDQLFALAGSVGSRAARQRHRLHGCHRRRLPDPWLVCAEPWQESNALR
jgi:DNA-binding GntR family transcriptional regulator